ncbi:MAG: hypothetical protein HKP58_11330 [Desulfatitalea sp.]|nr:hypothetical protein [Desulfatitalea sp.]
MKERAFYYGESNRGLGTIIVPEVTDEASPIVVMLNSGLLDRREPFRLNVLACRRLAAIGYIGLRVDLSGKGDTPVRNGLNNRESVALDWQFIKKALVNQFGERNLILMGLCSGADNGIKIAAQDPSVKGLILLDPISKRDSGYSRRAFMLKLKNPYKWVGFLKRLLKRIARLAAEDNASVHPISLRDLPNDLDLQQCFRQLVTAKGRVFALFTSYSLFHYNQKGQYTRAMGLSGMADICDEYFWPHVQHLYPVEYHREQLLDALCDWCAMHLNRFRSK